MKRVILPDVTFTMVDANGATRSVSGVEQLRILISVPSRPDSPFTLDDIRLRIPVVEKLEAFEQNGAGKELLLEDAEHALILSSLKASTWTGVSKAALELADAVEKAETVGAKE